MGIENYVFESKELALFLVLKMRLEENRKWHVILLTGSMVKQARSQSTDTPIFRNCS